MDCEQVRELLPGYVLGALEADEVTAVEEHLRAGSEHESELVDLRSAVFSLDRTGVGGAIGPSTALAARISRIGLGSSPPERRQTALLPVRRAPSWFAAAAVVALIFVFAAGWFSARLLTGDSSTEVSLLLQGPGGEVLSVSGNVSDNSVTVIMDGLARLSADRSYQVWAIRGDTWLSIGVCNTNTAGGWRGTFPFKLQAGESIALTVEPAGGSDTPAGELLLRSSS